MPSWPTGFLFFLCQRGSWPLPLFARPEHAILVRAKFSWEGNNSRQISTRGPGAKLSDRPQGGNLGASEGNNSRIPEKNISRKKFRIPRPPCPASPSHLPGTRPLRPTSPAPCPPPNGSARRPSQAVFSQDVWRTLTLEDTWILGGYLEDTWRILILRRCAIRITYCIIWPFVVAHDLLGWVFFVATPLLVARNFTVHLTMR